MTGVPYTFATATSPIPLSQLDSNFNTTLTIGSTSVGLGNSTASLANVSLTGSTSIAGANITAALTYGGVTLSNAVTGTGNMVLSASPTLTGTLTAATLAISGNINLNNTSGLQSKNHNGSGPFNAIFLNSSDEWQIGDVGVNGGFHFSNFTGGTDCFVIAASGGVTMTKPLTYGGVTLSNSVTGTGSMVLSASPTLTGTASMAAATATGGYSATGATANANVLGAQWDFDGTNARFFAYKSTGASMLFYTTPNGGTVSEAGRFDTSGNFLINATSGDANAKLQLGGTATTMRFLPTVDNTGYVGQASLRWAAIYAANGTIQTSDGREKNTVENRVLGFDFFKSLRPVSYKWNVGENVVTFDEDGKQIITPRPGTRTHFGFIAQEVETALNGQDFGGYVKEPDGKLGLRYDQFISPLVAAIQELTARLTALENK